MRCLPRPFLEALHFDDLLLSFGDGGALTAWWEADERRDIFVAFSADAHLLEDAEVQRFDDIGPGEPFGAFHATDSLHVATVAAGHLRSWSVHRRGHPHLGMDLYDAVDVPDSDVTLVTGSFRYVGTLGRNAARLAHSGRYTGHLLPPPSEFVRWRRVDVMAEDGEGGVYIAGTPEVDGPRTIRRIDWRGEYTAFEVSTIDGAIVRALHRVGDRLLVGGAFSAVDGEPRYGVALLDAETGALLDEAPLNRHPDPEQQFVRSIIPFGDGFLVHGMLEDADDTRYIAALLDASGSFVRFVDLPARLGTSVVAGAQLRFVEMDGLLWAAGYPGVDFDADYEVLALDPETFEEVGEGVPVNGFAFHIVAAGDRLLILGHFQDPATDEFHSLWELDRETRTLTQAVLGGDPDLSDIEAVQVVGDTLWIRSQSPLFPEEGETHFIASWDANTLARSLMEGTFVGGGTSGGFLATADQLWMAGTFQVVQPLLRATLVAYDRSTGWVRDIDFGIRGRDVAESLWVHEDEVYVSGYFTEFLGDERAHVAVLDAATLALSPRVIDVGDYVSSATVVGDAVYLAGFFDSAAGESRQNFAVIDLETGSALPSIDGPEDGLFPPFRGVFENLLIYAGSGVSPWMSSPRGIAVLDTASQTLLPFDPGLSGVRGAAVVDGSLFLVGDDEEVAGSTRVAGLSRWSLPELNLDDWSLDVVQGDAQSVSPHPEGLALAGDFELADGTSWQLLVVDPASGEVVQRVAQLQARSNLRVFRVGDGFLLGGTFDAVNGVFTQSNTLLDREGNPLQ